MRKCVRCGASMEEDLFIKVMDGKNVIVRTKGFSSKSAALKSAVCPVCGEVSIYVEDPQKLQK